MADDSPRVPVRLLLAIAFSAALGPLNSTMVAVALPEISRTLGADSATLRQALVTSYLLANIVLQSPGGKLGDRMGHRRALALGQILLGFGAAIAYLWPILHVLTIGRVVMATGGAIVMPSAMALLRSEVPIEVRGRVFGMFGAMIGLSAGLGPTVGALLVGHFGWKSIFLANVPMLGLSAALAYIGKRPQTAATPAHTSRFDVLGSTLLGLSLLGLVVGLQDSTHYLWLAVLGVLGFVPFVIWEKRASDPVVDFSLFRQRGFVAGTILVAFQNFAMYSLIFELPQVAGRLFKVGPRDVGQTLLAMMGTMVFTAPIAGRAADRFGGRTIALFGSAVALGGMVLLFFRPLTSLRDAVPGLLLLGIGMGLSGSPTQTVAISDVPKEKSGMASGLASTLRYVGGIAGVTVLGMVLSDQSATEVVMHEHRVAIVMFSVSLVLAMVCAFLLPRTIAAPASPGRSP